MKGYTNWSSRPYRRLDAASGPYICRLVPVKCGFELEWIHDGHQSAAHSLFFRIRGGEWLRKKLDGSTVSVQNLENQAEYELYIREDRTGLCGAVRLVRTGAFPEIVLDYLHCEDSSNDHSGRSLYSSPIVRLPSGGLITAADSFDTSPDWPSDSIGAKLFRSDDDGLTWSYLCEIVPAYWVTPFLHGGALYIISAAGEYGSVLISRSDDEGATWCAPATLFFGEGRRGHGWLLGGCSVFEHGGRIYFAAEYGCEPHYREEPGEEIKKQRRTPFFNWRGTYVCTDFVSAVLSADAQGDLLDPANWHCSGFFAPDPKICWCIEGSVYAAPDGAVRYIARTNQRNKALVLKCDANNPDAPLIFDKMIDFPFYGSNFDLKFDAVSGKYIAVGNEMGGAENILSRSVLSLISSDDAVKWKVGLRILDCRDTVDIGNSLSTPFFLIDGDDLLVSVRTSWGGNDWHDTNAVTIHRVRDFRKFL